ncbi:hypothetical protein GGI07_003709 [Coemansia sp. Benny D115]|nr:hypothetical protein GGI07_003709 [Coemansia sp. Benny D115]
MGLSLQTLPAQVVGRIVALCYDRQVPDFHPKYYKSYRHLRDLSHMCRRLRQAALPYIQERLVFERYNLAVEGVDSAKLSHEAAKAAKKLPPLIRWETNLAPIAAQNLTSGVREVVISTFDRYPEPQDILAMLQSHKVDHYKFPAVNTLILNFKSDYDLDDHTGDDSDWIPDDAFTALAQYIEAVFPAVDALWLDDNRCRRVGRRNSMSCYISRRLQTMRVMYLRFAHLPSFGVKALPPQLTHLTLSVYSAYDYIDIPRISTAALQSLTLSAIPLNYLWDRFCLTPTTDHSNGCSGRQTVEFPELRRLDLTFHVPYRTVPSGKSEDDLMWERYNREEPLPGLAPEAPASYKGNPKLKAISVKERIPKYTVLRTDTRQPRFPRLQHLHIAMYPGRVCKFLSLVPAEQLLSLRISGDLVVYKGMRLSAFTNLRECDLAHYSESSYRQSPHANRFLVQGLSQPSPKLRRLELMASSQCRLRLPPRDRIRCASIRRLQMTAHILYSDVPELLRSLPQLEYLDLQRAAFVHPPADAVGPEGLARHLLKAGMQPISTSLITFVADAMGRNSTDEIVFYNIFMLIARIPSLRVLKMFSFYATLFFNELLPMLKIPELAPYIYHLVSLECGE